MKTTLIILIEIAKEIEFLAEFLTSREGKLVTTDDVIDALIIGDCKLSEAPPLYSHSRHSTGIREASKRRLEVTLSPNTYQRITALQESLRETAERVNPYADVDYSIGNLIYGLITGNYSLPEEIPGEPEGISQDREDAFQSTEDLTPNPEQWGQPGRLPFV
jgi:hypothetical protein